MNATLPGKRLDPFASQTQPQPSTTKPAAAGGKLNFGGIQKKAAASKTQYPVYVGGSETEQKQIRDTVDYLIENIPVVDAVDTAKKQLTHVVTPFYFQHASGKNEVESSVAVVGGRGELLIGFPKMLVGPALESDLAPILGSRLPQLFRSTFELKVNGDEIPAHHAQPLIDGRRSQRIEAEQPVRCALSRSGGTTACLEPKNRVEHISARGHDVSGIKEGAG